MLELRERWQQIPGIRQIKKPDAQKESFSSYFKCFVDETMEIATVTEFVKEEYEMVKSWENVQYYVLDRKPLVNAQT